jgi:hypothetical protein
MSGKRYSEVEIEKALIAAATLGIRPAARELEIPESTIRGMLNQDPERYAELKAQEAPKWRARAAAEIEDVVSDLTDLERLAAGRLRERLEKVEDKDLARTLKDISTSKGINAQHVANLRGQPTEVHEHRFSLEVVQKAIASIETTAEEVESPELPPAA